MEWYISSVSFRFELYSFLLQNMVTTPVTEPQDGDAAFFGKNCIAALVNTPGHWITYVKIASSWWCLRIVVGDLGLDIESPEVAVFSLP